MDFITMHSVPLRSKYCPKDPVTKHPQSMSGHFVYCLQKFQQHHLYHIHLAYKSFHPHSPLPNTIYSIPFPNVISDKAVAFNFVYSNFPLACFLYLIQAKMIGSPVLSLLLKHVVEMLLPVLQTYVVYTLTLSL
jgi:hypothetical protein